MLTAKLMNKKPFSRLSLLSLCCAMGASGLAQSQTEAEVDEVDAVQTLMSATPADTLHLPLGGLEALLPPCARPDSNFITLPGGQSGAMRLFVDKMDSVLLLGSGRVSILQIGGSHIQADMYTEVFRQRLDSLNGGLRPARGFLFPFSVAKTNNPPGYKVRRGGEWQMARCSVRKPRPALGVSGITVFTGSPAAWFSIDTDPDSAGRWLSSSLRLLARSATGWLVPVITLDDTTLRPSVTDSLGYVFRLPRPVSRFELRFETDTAAGAKADTFFVDGIVPGADDDGITFHTIGVNGASVPSYLRCELFERQLAALRPDLVILSIGINDASGPNFSADAFREAYDSLLATFRRVNPRCAFIFVTNNDSKRRVRRRRRVVNANGPVAREAFVTMAEKWHGGLWDLFGIMGGLGSMAQWQKAGLAQRDNVHFTRAGYKVIGAMFYDAFLNFYLDQEATDDND